MASILKLKRGTRAQLDNAAQNEELTPYEPIFITDEERFAIAKSETEYVDIGADPASSKETIYIDDGNFSTYFSAATPNRQNYVNRRFIFNIVSNNLVFIPLVIRDFDNPDENWNYPVIGTVFQTGDIFEIVNNSISDSIKIIGLIFDGVTEYNFIELKEDLQEYGGEIRPGETAIIEIKDPRKVTVNIMESQDSIIRLKYENTSYPFLAINGNGQHYVYSNLVMGGESVDCAIYDTPDINNDYMENDHKTITYGFNILTNNSNKVINLVPSNEFISLALVGTLLPQVLPGETVRCVISANDNPMGTQNYQTWDIIKETINNNYIKDITGTSRTISLIDERQTLRFTDTGAKTVTFDSNDITYLKGLWFNIVNDSSSGNITIGVANGVTINALGSALIVKPGENRKFLFTSDNIAIVTDYQEGTDGGGVPEGGDEGQILVKSSEDDFDTEWKSPNPVAVKVYKADNKALNVVTTEDGHYVKVTKADGVTELTVSVTNNGVSPPVTTQGPIPRYLAEDPLPASNIGPIWHDGYVSIMTWRTIGSYIGYASTNVGQLAHFDGDIPPGYVSSIADISADEFEALRAYTGLTSTRDARGVVIRGLDSGRGLDSSRVLGSYQADGIRQSTTSFRRDQGGVGILYGEATNEFSITQVSDATGPMQASSGTNGRSRLTLGSAPETRMKNLALTACWKY